MYKFLELKHSEYGYRTSLEPFGEYDRVKVIPLYALSNLCFSCKPKRISLIIIGLHALVTI
ncbi:MAG: hypothetical protein LBS07_00535 [Prevotellaceae bacterium]|nr:hypothetical protein [Prevotellaceae bacterium]